MNGPQVVRNVRDYDQVQIASEIIVCLLTQQDPQFRSEAHFQLHSLVQDILGKNYRSFDKVQKV